VKNCSLEGVPRSFPELRSSCKGLKMRENKGITVRGKNLAIKKYFVIDDFVYPLRTIAAL
jgi:hypothetical protein